jgi:hypothetical protein
MKKFTQEQQPALTELISLAVISVSIESLAVSSTLLPDGHHQGLTDAIRAPMDEYTKSMNIARTRLIE